MPANNVAKYTTDIILWGNNSLSTRNPLAYATVRAIEDMKARNSSNQVIYIGPEFSDTGVTCADEWYVSKPYTDAALIAGMIYHMLDNTFDLNTGALKPNPWLDIDYLDTMVYGFFDSPAYKLKEDDGTISSGSAGAGERNINEVKKGGSYCSWILGNNNHAPKYSATTSNYTAKEYAKIDSASTRWSTCSYTATKGANSKYLTKKDYITPKTPEWAEKITGIPAEQIKHLAEVFVKKNAQVLSLWSGGMQKQSNGVINMFALQSLHIITKNVYQKGAGLAWRIEPSITKPAGLDIIIEGEDFTGTIVPEKPQASCVAWHNAIKLAYGDELKANGYKAQYIPDWKTDEIGTGKVYEDDGGAKAMLAWDRDEKGKIKVKPDGYYQWKNDSSGKPLYAGIRLMYNTGGNIFINQHENSNDSREMLECLPLNDGNADSFCLVSFDNFLSPTPMYSDYVLPAATNWEQPDIISPTNSTPFYMPVVTTPPGESKSTWDFAEALLESYQTGLSSKLTGGHSMEFHVKKAFNKASADPSSFYYGKTWEDYIKNPYLTAQSNDYSESAPSMVGTFSFDEYKKANKTQPFVKKSAGFYANVDDGGSAPISSSSYGNEYTDTTKATAPKSPLRFSVYSDIFVWNYEKRFEKWHGYLPKEQQGQSNKDMEGDKIVCPIPMYYAYEDYFMEAYGNKLPDSSNRFLLTTTHNRYRSHSSMAENPMLRELSHRVPGVRANPNNGNSFKYREDQMKIANDYGYYANSPKNAFEINKVGNYPLYNETIKNDGTVEQKEIASYTEILINPDDAGKHNINNGDLIDVYNVIGAVRCVAKLSSRCAKGFLGLHQGCWYDIREIPNNATGHKFIDVGGNCNTLMASKSSRVDHGNGQQSAMVSIVKVNN